MSSTPKGVTIDYLKANELAGDECKAVKLLFTVDEAAKRLGVPASWLYQRTSRKAIPFRKMGKYVRFSESDLQAIINKAEAA